MTASLVPGILACHKGYRGGELGKLTQAAVSKALDCDEANGGGRLHIHPHKTAEAFGL